MENHVERIVEICKQKNIAVSKVEKDLGFGNGYLNPKKVSSIKTDRLIRILNYLGVSFEEFFNIGSKKLQTIETDLVQIKKASPEIYDEIMISLNSESTEDIKKTAIQKDDGTEKDYQELREILDQLSPENAALLKEQAQLLLRHQKSQGGQ